MGKKGALTEDGDERAAPIVLGVRGEEAVDADLLLRHQRLEEGGLGEAEPTRGGGGGGGGGRLLDWRRRRRGGRRRHRGGRDAPAWARASGRNRRRNCAGVAEAEWTGAGGDCEEETQLGVGDWLM